VGQGLVAALVPTLRKMGKPDAKSLGKILQGFRSTSGAPTGASAEALSLLVEKMPGWSGFANSQNGFVKAEEADQQGGKGDKEDVTVEKAVEDVDGVAVSTTKWTAKNAAKATGGKSRSIEANEVTVRR